MHVWGCLPRCVPICLTSMCGLLRLLGCAAGVSSVLGWTGWAMGLLIGCLCLGF